jgi:hypothetical protein
MPGRYCAIFASHAPSFGNIVAHWRGWRVTLRCQNTHKIHVLCEKMTPACIFPVQYPRDDATINFIALGLAIKALFLLRTSLPCNALVGRAGRMRGDDNGNNS